MKQTFKRGPFILSLFLIIGSVNIALGDDAVPDELLTETKTWKVVFDGYFEKPGKYEKQETWLRLKAINRKEGRTYRESFTVYRLKEKPPSQLQASLKGKNGCLVVTRYKYGDVIVKFTLAPEKGIQVADKIKTWNNQFSPDGSLLAYQHYHRRDGPLPTQTFALHMLHITPKKFVDNVVYPQKFRGRDGINLWEEDPEQRLFLNSSRDLGLKWTKDSRWLFFLPTKGARLAGAKRFHFFLVGIRIHQKQTRSKTVVKQIDQKTLLSKHVQKPYKTYLIFRNLSIQRKNETFVFTMDWKTREMDRNKYKRHTIVIDASKHKSGKRNK